MVLAWAAPPPNMLLPLDEGAVVDGWVEDEVSTGFEVAPPRLAKRLPAGAGAAAVDAGCEVDEDAGAPLLKRLPELAGLSAAAAPPPNMLPDAAGAGLAAAPSGFLPKALLKRLDPDVAVELGAVCPLEAWLF